MYCTKCGKKNADDRLFCGFCGSPLDTNEPSEAKEDVEQSAPAPAVEPPAAEPAQAPAPEEPAPMSRRARHAKMIEEAAKAEEEWPDLDIEPPIPPRPQFKDASAADEEETKAPFE